MKPVFGVDFGTSNTSAAVLTASGVSLIPLEGSNPVLPSAVFYSFEKDAPEPVVFGRAATQHYIDEEFGRYFRSLKSVLGSSIVNDRFMIRHKVKTFGIITQEFLRHVLLQSATHTGQSVDCLVLGRPVYFVDGDPVRDLQAQNQLEAIAKELGVQHVAFQYEPIAAALDYEQAVTGEELAFIVDMGGGTSDFTVVRLSPARALAHDRSQDILSNNGVHIGGTDLDRDLSMAQVMPLFGSQSVYKQNHNLVNQFYFTRMATWHQIPQLYERTEMQHLDSVPIHLADSKLFERYLKLVRRRYGHAVAYRVEAAKVALSETVEANIALDFVEKDLRTVVTRPQFEEAVAPLLDRTRIAMLETLALAGVSSTQVSSVFCTGGTTLVPAVRNIVRGIFPDAKIIEGDSFCSVATGLALDARRKFE